jgi:hypothetical protein
MVGMAARIVRSLQHVKVQNIHVDTSVLWYGLHISILVNAKMFHEVVIIYAAVQQQPEYIKMKQAILIMKSDFHCVICRYRNLS